MKKFKISYDLLKGGTAFLTSLENDLEFKLDDTHIENLLDEKYFPDAHSNNNITTGEPFNARLSLKYDF